MVTGEILSIESIKLINKVAGRINIFTNLLVNNILPYIATFLISFITNMSTAGMYSIKCKNKGYANSKQYFEKVFGCILLGMLLQVISIICYLKSLKSNTFGIYKLFGNFTISMLAGLLTGAYPGAFIGYNAIVGLKHLIINVSVANDGKKK